jgi:hypothetical protein
MTRFDDMSPEKLEQLRKMIEEVDNITAVEEDTRTFIEERWPWLVCKLPPTGLPSQSKELRPKPIP